MKTQLIKYFLFGLFQFLLDFLLFVWLEKAGVMVILANTASRLIAAVAGYCLNKKYTFDAGAVKSRAMFVRFWLFWLFMTGFSSLLMLAWSKAMAGTWSNGIGKLIVEALMFCFGFLISKMWVYKHDR